MFRALLCSSSGDQNRISAASGIVTLKPSEWSKLLNCSLLSAIIKIAKPPSRHLEKKPQQQ
jgi:hypothetical protein